ncbi:MAG TPA: response regulator transcription factor [Arachnia sp.]|nr:response regulator transcription factor [Arachnia sp.]
MEELRVALVDDDPVFAYTFADNLGRVGVRVLWIAADGPTALSRLKLPADLPDVLAVDVMMPGMSGHQLASQVRDCHPDLPVVMCTALDRSDTLQKALDVGARGYLVKHDPPDRVAGLLRGAVAGELAFSQSSVERLVQSFRANEVKPCPLSPRAIEILGLAKRGYTNVRIASLLGCSPYTVKQHLSTAYAKLDVADRAQAVAVSIENGWI